MSATICDWIFHTIVRSGMIVSHPAGPGGSERDPETVAAFRAAAFAMARARVTGLVPCGSRVAGMWDRTRMMARWTSAGTSRMLIRLGFQLRVVLFDEGANLVRSAAPTRLRDLHLTSRDCIRVRRENPDHRSGHGLRFALPAAAGWVSMM